MGTTVERTYVVTGMSCEHCEAAVKSAVGRLAGIADTTVDLQSGVVTVRGEWLDDDAVRAAINDAGYEVAS